MHDAARRAVPGHMCALRMRVGHVEHVSEISQSSRSTTLESNMKNEHKLYLVCEDNVLSLFSLTLVLFCPLIFYCTFTSLLSLV